MKRVLHVVGRMHRAGIETWLMHVVRRFERRAAQHDFLVHSGEPAAYDAELWERGSRLYRVKGERRSVGYPLALDEAFGEALADGPVDVVHAHEQLWCGPILEAAARAGIGTRIAHSHNDTKRLERIPNLPRILFGSWMRPRIRRAMTHGISCSAMAAPSLFGEGWQSDPRVAVLRYGLDFEAFMPAEAPARVRQRLGIPHDRQVIGHVGRCEPQKNQRFMLEVFRQAARLRPDLHLLMVGEGALEEQLRSRIRAYDLASRITWLKNRSDIPALMVSAMDMFLLPSAHEGLPLVLLEAQAAGLPCLFSTEVTAEADLFPATNMRLSHRDSAEAWAGALQALSRAGRGDRAARIRVMSAGEFSVEHAVRRLAELYGVGAGVAVNGVEEEVRV